MLLSFAYLSACTKQTMITSLANFSSIETGIASALRIGILLQYTPTKYGKYV